MCITKTQYSNLIKSIGSLCEKDNIDLTDCIEGNVFNMNIFLEKLQSSENSELLIQIQNSLSKE